MKSNEGRSPRDKNSGDSAAEDRKEEILAGLIDRFLQGEIIDLDSIAAEHGELGPEIVEQLKTFSVEPMATELSDGDLGSLGDYTLRRQIGRGGMGVVYEAWENSIGRPVALKVLPMGIAADPRAAARFLREAQAAGQLNHPHVVGIHAMGVYENTPYYSMEYVEGETLAQILRRTRDLPQTAETPLGKMGELAFYSNLASAFASVADGLQHAHSRGVIHRDIKPSNLILDGGSDRGGSSHGRLRILDFGLARLEGQESLTISGDLVGTPLYMSPEQARRHKIPVDQRTDVYSLGATMYEVLAGRPPFRGKDHHDTLSQIIERDAVEPRKFNPRVPKDLETIVLKCLRKDAGDRYGTAAALGQDLRRFAKGDPIEARPLGPWANFRRRLVRNRRVIVSRSLLVFVVLACGFLAYAVYFSEKEEWRFDDVQAVDEANSPYMESCPTCSADDCELYFGSFRPGGKGSWDIWVVSRPGPEKPWGVAQNIAELNSPSQEEPAWLSRDGLRLYYTRWIEGKGKEILVARRHGRHPAVPWEPIDTGEFALLSSEYDEGSPCLSADELEIYFYSERPEGSGKRDIWVSKRDYRDQPWGPPRDLREINGQANEFGPCLSSDGRTLWWHKQNRGGIWCATRANRESGFGQSEPVGSPLASYDWDGQIDVSPRWPAPGSVAYFLRGHFGEQKDFDIYRAIWRLAPPRSSDSREGGESSSEGAGNDEGQRD